ncbi:D-2-hydroxyacid dehydrogenase [Acidovorax sp. JG5]|uniref:D-2-hydroxyacid dehydrogenase n=1 Tax=Comamonadaceae TaxID=80864 RepID=UPI001B3291BC|nr:MULTISPECIES: D-2-hydroxyacid dehydrogenase [Comamonadaceae]MBP3982661.1 D-2-hydroxyacid dehydrogenase [Acidovorax sp. JG5]HMP11535.1 D-2-hydroxyacid dehydrogenase [Hydrogenophaga sp.]
MKIVFLDRNTLSPQTVLRPPKFTHQLETYEQSSPQEVKERIADADIVVVNKVKLTRDAIASAKKLKLVAVAATGFDNVDVGACHEHGVSVSNIRNYAVNTVPEHTFALIFSLRRSICAYQEAVRSGRWQDSGQFCFFDFPIKDLAGSTLGVIGDGVLGQAVAQMGRALGMRVIFAGYKGSSNQGVLYTPFEETLRSADILTLHCPLTKETHNMIGSTEFAMMKRKPLLINTARGGLVDESAVGPALDAGHIGGAAFDVVSVEPPPKNHPFMSLVNRPNFILTPHVAWASDEAIQGLADQLIENIESFVRGEPRNLVGV